MSNKVSVVIPTYNRAKLLKRTVLSVLNQTYRDFEIIVVDDASTDDTEEVVRSFSDERIRYIRHNENKGDAAARNIGIKAAKGQFIAFQDSDDEWLPEKLQRQMEIFENVLPNVGVIYTGFLKIKGKRKIYLPPSRIIKRNGDIHNELLKGNFIGTSTAVIKKGCFKRTGMFDERLPHLVDWEMWLRVSKYYHFKYVDAPLVNVYYSPNSISANQNALITGQKLLLERHYEEFKKDRELLARHLYSIGNCLCQNRQIEQGRNYLLRALKLYPLNPKYVVAAFTSMFGSKIYNEVVEIKRLFVPSDME